MRDHAGTLAWLALVILGLLILATPAHSARPSAALGSDTPPNFVVILVDDWGIEHAREWRIGSAPFPATPNIDAAALSGVIFSQGYSQPVCSPARASLLTGLYAIHHGVGEAVQDAGDKGLALSFTTIAEALPDSYSKAIFGKWHLGVGVAEGGEDAPLDQGFDYSLVTDGNPYPDGDDYYNWHWRRNGVLESGTGYLTTATTDEASAWVGSVGRPFFLYLALHAPHGPYEAPPGRSCDDPQSCYSAMVEAMDEALGLFLGSLPDDTVIFLASDNGSPGGIAEPPVCPERAKHTAMEGGVRVPFAVWGQGVEPGWITDPVMVLDVYATILSLAGAEPGLTDSVDLSPYFSGTPPEPLRDHVFVETFGDGSSWRAARSECYKVHVRAGYGQRMFDLCADPWERVNLYDGDLSAEEQAAYDELTAFMLGLSH